ncbi:sporulation protein YqfC [Lentibacillus sp.]|uniref:sporulation protein YqfC n=1 Tax=Lentibacillus sp. TaxID=1925746 RepID=UPI002B4B4B9A|nr:sporulation protein YqfC [Lentibacillus sp.]HLS08535.1 sporulation protein YqfC [Lentibacillus sp.]
MKKWQQRIRPWLAKSFSLPSDVMMELPRVTMIGQLHVYIENHQGLMVYSDSELRLKSNKGYIQIKGSSFVLKMMLPEEILLEGTIDEVKFVPHITDSNPPKDGG